jgi:hypothetical protein
VLDLGAKGVSTTDGGSRRSGNLSCGLKKKAPPVRGGAKSVSQSSDCCDRCVLVQWQTRAFNEQSNERTERTCAFATQ